MHARLAALSDETAVSALLLAAYTDLMAKDYDPKVLAAALPRMVRANPSSPAQAAGSVRDGTIKSFLLLFFKKEESSFLKERSKELLPFGYAVRTAGFTAIQYLVPAGFPFFAPGEGAAAAHANLAGQVRLLAHQALRVRRIPSSPRAWISVPQARI